MLDGDKVVADYNLYLRTLEYKDLKFVIYYLYDPERIERKVN